MNVPSNISTTTKQLIDHITLTIISDQQDEIIDVLDVFNFDQMELKDSTNLLTLFIKYCYQYNKPKIAKIIYDYHTSFYSLSSDVSFFTYLLLINNINIEVFSFLINDVSLNHNFYEIVYELIFVTDEFSSDEISLAFSKAAQIFKMPDLEQLLKMQEFSEHRNPVIYSELTDIIRKVNNFAPIPDWMITLDILPKESSVQPPSKANYNIGIPTNDQIFNLLKVDIKNEINDLMSCDKETVDKLSEEVISGFNALSLEAKNNQLDEFYGKNVKLALEDDRQLFLTYGPSAPFVDATLEELDYGGARMFLFNNFDTTDDYDDFEYNDDGTSRNIVEWFVGYCEQCDLKIRRKWHAVRIPIKYGGWKGCFCSFECVRNNIVETYNSDEIMLTLVDIYEQQMQKYGIIDRIPDIEYNDYISNLLDNFDNKRNLEKSKKLQYNPDVDMEISEVIESNDMQIQASNIVMNYFFDNSIICSNFTPQLYQLVEFDSMSPDDDIKQSVTINEINIEDNDVSSTGIKQVPTVVLSKDDEVIHVFVGANIRPILDKINELRGINY